MRELKKEERVGGVVGWRWTEQREGVEAENSSEWGNVNYHEVARWRMKAIKW